MPLRGNTKSSRQCCLCHLSRAIGFADDVPLNFINKKFIQTFAPFHKEADQSSVPAMFSGVFEDSSTGTLNLMTDGDVELVVQCCDTFWNGSRLQILNDEVSKRILEFYQNALVNDMEIVAYAYGPVDRALRFCLVSRQVSRRRQPRQEPALSHTRPWRWNNFCP